MVNETIVNPLERTRLKVLAASLLRELREPHAGLGDHVPMSAHRGGGLCSGAVVGVHRGHASLDEKARQCAKPLLRQLAIVASQLHDHRAQKAIAPLQTPQSRAHRPAIIYKETEVARP